MRTSGAGPGRLWWVIIAAILLVFPIVLNSCTPVLNATAQGTAIDIAADDSGEIIVQAPNSETGAVVDNVVVRVANSSIVDGVDHRELRTGPCALGQFLVVSAPGYKTSIRNCDGSNTYTVPLTKLHVVDDVNYSWLSAEENCMACHAGQFYEGYNEFSEWGKTAHARVFIDPFFANMYLGTNIQGQSTPSNPGFKADTPGQAGDCAYCHAPSTISPSKAPTDLTSYYPRLGGAMGEGVTCDICHKVIDVDLDDTGYPKLPGILSLKFLRTSAPFIVGPFSNLPSSPGVGTTTYTCGLVLSESEFCAACHYGKFNEMTIYNSYGEWMESMYGRDRDSIEYKTCQDCHMSHMDVNNVGIPLSRRRACSETDPGFQNFDHNLLDVGPKIPGSSVETPRMIQHAASLGVKVKYEPVKNQLKIFVEVENMRAGHKFPTDSPLRHLLLVVDPTDQFDKSLPQVSGEKLPDWAGPGNTNTSNATSGIIGYAGKAGTIYANLLVDERTNISPTAAYWNKTRYAYTTASGENSDTRLVPGDPQMTEYDFDVPDLGKIHVNVKLIYRFAFFDLMAQKGWNRPDVVVAMADCVIDLEKMDGVTCSEAALP